MFLPLPRTLLFPLRLLKLLWAWSQRSREWTQKDIHVLRWLRRRDDPIRPKDRAARNFDELTEAARNGSRLLIAYIDSDRKTSQRVIILERIFRRGERLYVEAFYPEIREYRRLRLDRIQSFRSL